MGTKVKHAEIISKGEEGRLWDSGVMGATSPSALLNAVFLCNGKNFCLPGGQEHRRLKISQLERLHDPDHYIYTENCFKTMPELLTSSMFRARLSQYTALVAMQLRPTRDVMFTC